MAIFKMTQQYSEGMFFYNNRCKDVSVIERCLGKFIRVSWYTQTDYNISLCLQQRRYNGIVDFLFDFTVICSIYIIFILLSLFG